MKDKALVVLSGGQDSTTCLAFAKQHHSEVIAVSMNYGQRHSRELESAVQVAALLAVPLEVIMVGPLLKGTSPLVNQAEELEQYQDFESMDKIIGDRVEKTFVPMRNALFLTIAANRAVVEGCTNIYTGVCQADNANYPDCRLTFINAQEKAINEALGFTEPGEGGAIHIVTPLMEMTKAQSIQRLLQMPSGRAIGWDASSAVSLGYFPLLAFTHTSYDGKYPPTDQNHANVLRAQGFFEAGVADPLVVRAWMEGRMTLPDTGNYKGVWHPERGSAGIALVKLIAFLKQNLAASGLGNWAEYDGAGREQ